MVFSDDFLHFVKIKKFFDWIHQNYLVALSIKQFNTNQIIWKWKTIKCKVKYLKFYIQRYGFWIYSNRKFWPRLSYMFLHTCMFDSMCIHLFDFQCESVINKRKKTSYKISTWLYIGTSGNWKLYQLSNYTVGLPKIYHKGRITFCSSFKNTFLKSNNYTIYLISFSQNEALCNSDLWRHVTVLYCSTGPNCIVATCTLFSKLTQYQWTYYFVIHLFYPIKA